MRNAMLQEPNDTPDIGALPKKRCLELLGARDSSVYWVGRVPDTFFWADSWAAGVLRAGGFRKGDAWGRGGNHGRLTRSSSGGARRPRPPQWNDDRSVARTERGLQRSCRIRPRPQPGQRGVRPVL